MEISKRWANRLGIAVILILTIVEFIGAVREEADASSTSSNRIAGVMLNRHDVVLSSTLSHCANDEVAKQPVVPCTWNIGYPDGNGRGAAYVLHRVTGPHGHHPLVARYVWARSPIHDGWLWEGGPQSGSDCVVKWITNRWVERCPGERVASPHKAQSTEAEPRLGR